MSYSYNQYSQPQYNNGPPPPGENRFQNEGGYYQNNYDNQYQQGPPEPGMTNFNNNGGPPQPGQNCFSGPQGNNYGNYGVPPPGNNNFHTENQGMIQPPYQPPMGPCSYCGGSHMANEKCSRDMNQYQSGPVRPCAYHPGGHAYGEQCPMDPSAARDQYNRGAVPRPCVYCNGGHMPGEPCSNRN